MDFLKDLSMDKVINVAQDAFNQAKPKTEVEARVYEVLSHKNWGSSSSLMNEIARDTFDYERFAIISQIMWENLENQRPAAWRVVFKGLTLLEHLIKNGSERCVDDARNHGHTLRALHQFNYYEGTVDRGLGVREKSKQIVEILSDDERIREERQKARKLREKFGGNLGGVSGGGGAYSGYGNDNWDSGRGGGGYGESGIGSDTYRSGGGGGRYGDDRDGGGYSGRYDDNYDTRPASSSTPTFASLPDEPKKSKKPKKKKKEEAEAAPEPAAPEVDLFSFDEPSPTPATSEPASDEFDAFQSAGGSTSAQANDPFAAPAPAVQQNGQFDAFGGAQSAPMQQQQQQNGQFDAFAGAQQNAPMQQQQNSQFDAFGGSAPVQQQQNAQFNVAFGGTGGAMNGMQQQPAMGGSNVMGGGMGGNVPQTTTQNDEDEFGDFADAAPSKGSSNAATSSDPMSKLISLDGLTKNVTKKKDKLSEPVIANAAAATFVQEKDMIEQNVQQSKKGSAKSFEGLDGLPKMSMNSGTGHMQMNMMPPSSMNVGFNPSVMGSGSGTDAIGMLDPKLMMQNNAKQQQQQPSHGGMNPQMMANQQMMGNPQMMANQKMMGNQQMMGSTQMMGGTTGMNPGMQQGFGMQGMGMNPQQQQQQQMMMNNQSIGGMQQGFGSMQGSMQQGNMMGGQQQGGSQMGGFR